jgi:hypothetical protein
MLEISVLVVVVAGAALVVGRLRHGPDQDLHFIEDPVDLPCPWCRAPTREEDTACPSCAHPFGTVTRS